LLTAVSARFLYFSHYHVAPPLPESAYFACALLPDTLPLPSPWEDVRKWGGAALVPPNFSPLTRPPESSSPTSCRRLILVWLCMVYVIAKTARYPSFAFPLGAVKGGRGEFGKAIVHNPTAADTLVLTFTKFVQPPLFRWIRNFTPRNPINSFLFSVFVTPYLAYPLDRHDRPDLSRSHSLFGCYEPYANHSRSLLVACVLFKAAQSTFGPVFQSARLVYLVFYFFEFRSDPLT
jgi:hypothetical protein